VPVPWDEGHVFYVWYDALINYATAVGYGADPSRFDAWSPTVHHLIGKDILRFHCVYWPAMCLAAGIEPPKKIAVHGFLLVGGEKMSKTRLNQIFPADLVEDFGVDGFRYQFLRDNPFGPDGDFSYEAMVNRFNTDLANNLGNLMSRVATVVGKKCGGVGPAPSPGSPLAEVAEEAYTATAAAWDAIAPSVALEATWRLIGAANAHLEANEPWKMEPGPELDAVMGDALEVLRLVAVLASPAVPAACAEVWRRIGLDGSPLDQRLPAAAAWGGYPGGLTVEKGAPLFPRLTAPAS
jgi:methionyl-tRNA synthetase